MSDNTTSTIPGVVHTTDARFDPWVGILRSLRKIAHTAVYGGNRCHAILTVHIWVDDDAQPIQYTRPRFRRLDPKANNDAVEALLETLSS